MDNKTPAEICEAIALDFKARKITHQQAGDAIGKSKAIISNQISGKKPFSKTMAGLFSRAFGYRTRFLLYGEGELRGDSVVRDVVQVPDPDGSIRDDVILLASLLSVADEILRINGDKDAINAWESIKKGDFDRFCSSMKSLSSNHSSPTYIPIIAKFICDKIKGSKFIVAQ